MRSAGTSDKARRRVTEADISWADLIYVMESKHRKLLRHQFGEVLTEKILFVLDIPDDYKYMDSELVDLLESGVIATLT